MSEKTIDTTAVVLRDPNPSSTSIARAEDFMPLLSVEQAVARKGMINSFIGQVLHEGNQAGEGDYGLMPGTSKKILFKPGAEKLCSIFGLAPQYIEDKIIEDWTGEEHGGEPLFYYSYRCQLTRGGQFMGEAIGSCNSWETKYRYRWVSEEIAERRKDFEDLPVRGGIKKLFEPDFALEKQETGGQYGKPIEYWYDWADAIKSGEARRAEKQLGKKKYQGYEREVDEKQYRIPNPDVADAINTCQKLAQKRALVAAVLVVTNCSDAFTQDMEDFPPQDTGGAARPKGAAANTNAGAAAASTAGDEPPVPQELRKLYERIERDPSQFGNAVKSLEEALAHKFGVADGLNMYDAIAEDFYTRFPEGTRDVKELKGVLLALHNALEGKGAPAATVGAGPAK